MFSSYRPRTVLFVDICGSTHLYESIGDRAASEAVMRCLGELRVRVEAHKGKVVQRIGDELMCVFDQSDAALDAARDMQLWVSIHQGAQQPALSIRVGCHFGAVIERKNDLFGDAVNVAARAAAFAQAEQVITTEDTVAQLSNALRDSVRGLGTFALKGKRQDLALYEFVWRPSDEATIAVSSREMLRHPTRLVLSHGDGELLLDGNDRSTITLGRDPACHLVITDPQASRMHARIETRQNKFVLIDQSVNGTYVTVGDEEEIALRREELTLYGHGHIHLGHRALDSGAAPIKYSCE